MYSIRPTIVSVTETWLSSNIYNNEILPTGYSLFRADRPSRGGGALLAILSDIPVSVVHVQSDPDIVCVKIISPTPIICAPFTYLPPPLNLLSSPFCYIFVISSHPVHTLSLSRVTSIAQTSTGTCSHPPLPSLLICVI